MEGSDELDEAYQAEKAELKARFREKRKEMEERHRAELVALTSDEAARLLKYENKAEECTCSILDLVFACKTDKPLYHSGSTSPPTVSFSQGFSRPRRTPTSQTPRASSPSPGSTTDPATHPASSIPRGSSPLPGSPTSPAAPHTRSKLRSRSLRRVFSAAPFSA